MSVILAGTTAIVLLHDVTKTQNDPYTDTSEPHKQPHVGIIETDFTDKLAAKPYLRHHNPLGRDSIFTSTIQTTRRIWGKLARNDSPVVRHPMDLEEDIVNGELAMNTEGPRGVPHRIRILAIDVPEFREVFDGECRVDLSKIYPDGVAPPKVIKRKKETNPTKSTNGAEGREKDTSKEQNDIQVMQKSLARSLVRCRNKTSKRIGVDLLEASVYDLNPHNMRRTYQYGTFSYDPGKYGSMTKAPGADLLQRRRTMNTEAVGVQRRNSIVATSSSSDTKEKEVEEEKGYADPEEELEEQSSEEEILLSTYETQTTPQVEDTTIGSSAKDTNIERRSAGTQLEETTVLASEDDEVDAPWNQYAWIEEMNIRIRGYVPFAGPIESSSFLSRRLIGNCYRRTVKSSRSIFHWFIPSFFTGEKVGGEEGIDGDYGQHRNRRILNWASSKPHAVIADGSAMQRVPGSLRHLTKCCLEADVPLFIINDPRVWGGNTHSDLESAAKDIRATIKARIVANALAIKEGKMFERGRMLGRIEAGAKWQAKDMGRRTRQAFEDAANQLRKKKGDDWSNLDGKELMKQLEEKNVIRVEHRGEGDKIIIDKGLKGAFRELCRLYSEQERKKENDEKEFGMQIEEIDVAKESEVVE